MSLKQAILEGVIDVSLTPHQRTRVKKHFIELIEEFVGTILAESEPVSESPKFMRQGNDIWKRTGDRRELMCRFHQEQQAREYFEWVIGRNRLKEQLAWLIDAIEDITTLDKEWVLPQLRSILSKLAEEKDNNG